MLFGIALDFVMRSSSESSLGINWLPDKKLGDLDFADDLCLLAPNVEIMQRKTTALSDTASKIGLNINIKKTEVMSTEGPINISLNNENLKQVEKFTYLGSTITSDGDCLHDVKARIAKAYGAMNKLNNIWKSNSLSKNTKLKIFNSNVMSVLLYGSDSWKTNAEIERRLTSFQCRCLRRILSIKWNTRTSNLEVLRISEMESVTSLARRNRWNYLGHVLRMPTTRIPVQAWSWTPDGRRQVGRPRGTLRRTITDDLRKCGNKYINLKRTADDRAKWRGLVSSLCSNVGTGR